MKTTLTLLTALLLAPPAALHAAEPPIPAVPAACPGGKHDVISARVKLGNVDLIVVGDSHIEKLKYGGSYLGKNGHDGGDEIDDGRLWKGSVWDKHYGKRRAVNMGIGGQRTQQILWRMLNGNLEGISPKVAVVMAGGNNLGSDKPEDIALGVKAIVEAVRAKLPATKILLVSYIPYGTTKTDGVRVQIGKINETASRLADDTHVFYVDIDAKLMNADGTRDDSMFEDKYHLNQKGQEIWAAAIEPTLAKLLGEK